MSSSDKYVSGAGKNRRYMARVIIALTIIGLLAILFTVSIIRIQSGTTAYLAGLSIWSRAQVEAVRYSYRYSQTGNLEDYQLAKKWLQIPVGDMEARLVLDSKNYIPEKAFDGLVQGGNHPDDVPTMMFLFRSFKNAPYLKDAIAAWRESDEPIVELQTLLEQIRLEWSSQEPNLFHIEELSNQLARINKRLEANAEQFRIKMSEASRAMALILTFATIIFFIVLFVVSTLLIIKLVASLKRSETKFRETFKQAGMGIAQLNQSGHILDANAAFCKILKKRKSAVIGQPYNSFFHAANDEQANDALKSAEEILRTTSFIRDVKFTDDSYVKTKVTISPLEDASSANVSFVCLLEDITEQSLLSKELRHQARHDELTGLVNRRAFKEYLEESVKYSQDEGHVHSLCFIDLDRFKIVNDTSGHFAGDTILQQIAKRLSSKLRKGDILARLGGDEFGLILNCCDTEQALRIADSLRVTLIDVPFLWNEKVFSVGCSIGMVPVNSESNAEELLKLADSACHLAKEQGRDRTVVTYPGDKKLDDRREQFEWIERVRNAVELDQLFLDAQKIVSTVNPKAIRIEVLIRMQSSDGDVIPPGAFIPAAERYGLAHLLDRWVINKVCEYFSDYAEELSQIEACHINISGRSFDQPDFTKFVIDTIAKYQIPGHKLCFEITETAAVSNIADIYSFMSALRSLDATFALDDFGSGLASFSYLKQLPVEYLKIDGTFVKNIATDEVDLAMVAAIAGIGHALDKNMVAEFVEDQAALDQLTNLGVAFAQGYYLHKPERFESLIKQLTP